MPELFDAPATAVATRPATVIATPTEINVTPATLLATLIESGRDASQYMELLEKWEARIAAEQYGHALAKFQGRCPQIHKGRKINLGGGEGPLYASLEIGRASCRERV